MSNDTKIQTDVKVEDSITEPIVEKRVLNPLIGRFVPGKNMIQSFEMTKNQFQAWAKTNGVGSSYSGNKKTMFIFGENAREIEKMAAGYVKFKIEIQED